MQVIRQASDVAQVLDPVLRGFLVKHIEHMARDWAPDPWPDFGQLLILEEGDDPAIVETAGCLRLLGSPFDSVRLGDPGFAPAWEWIDDHGGFYEVATLVSDAGGFFIVLIPKAAGTSPALLALCEQLSTGQGATGISPVQASGPLPA